MKRLTSQDRIIFTLDGFHNRTRRDWARAKRHAVSTPEGMAKSHARKHGKAGIWNSNDSLTLFYQVPGGLRQTTFPRAVPAPAKNWVAEVFHPLPACEVKLLRKYGV